MEKINKVQESVIIKPKILYYGTPVILLNTFNDDGSVNISPLSSWALGACIILGIELGGKALENLERHPECVINIPNPSLWESVERLAHFTKKILSQNIKRQWDFNIKRISMKFASARKKFKCVYLSIQANHKRVDGKCLAVCGIRGIDGWSIRRVWPLF